MTAAGAEDAGAGDGERAGGAADVVVVLVTAPDPGVAEELGRTVVEERLAACANLVPGVVSLFRWEGRLEREDEVLMVIKTTSARVDALERRLAGLHPYDTPEVLALRVDRGHAPYLAWVGSEVQS